MSSINNGSNPFADSMDPNDPNSVLYEDPNKAEEKRKREIGLDEESIKISDANDESINLLAVKSDAAPKTEHMRNRRLKIQGKDLI